MITQEGDEDDQFDGTYATQRTIGFNEVIENIYDDDDK